MKQKALLITESDFDKLVEEGLVDVIGSYVDLRTTISGVNPYVEYVIKPISLAVPNDPDKKFHIETVIITSKKTKPEVIDYPRNVR